jgi:hypothetical protein
MSFLDKLQVLSPGKELFVQQNHQPLHRTEQSKACRLN